MRRENDPKAVSYREQTNWYRNSHFASIVVIRIFITVST
jgi:hypothetical protein